MTTTTNLLNYKSIMLAIGLCINMENMGDDVDVKYMSQDRG